MCEKDCGWIFAQHFCNRLGPAYLALKNVLDESNPAHAEVLNDIKIRFREETFTRESILEVITAYPELVSEKIFRTLVSKRSLRDLMFVFLDPPPLCELCNDSLSPNG